MSLEIEVTYSAASGPVLLIGWFEGDGRARMVLSIPDGAREEIQINHIVASLAESARPLFTDQPTTHAGNAIVAKVNVSIDQRRVGRMAALSRIGSATALLCAKLIDMGALLARDPVIVVAVQALQTHLKPRSARPRRTGSHRALGTTKPPVTTASHRRRRVR